MKWLISLFLFSYSFANKPVSTKVETKLKNSSLVELLKDARLSLSDALPAEKQWNTFTASLKTFCDSFRSEEAKNMRSDYLEQLLLLAAKMYEIDSGKRATDCFSGYYALNAKAIDELIATLPPKQQAILKTEIDNAKAAFGRH